MENPDVFNPCLLLHHGPQGVPLSKAVTGCGCEKFVMPATGPVPAPPPTSCPSSPTDGGPGDPTPYNAGSMSGAGIITGLIMCAIGFFLGQWRGRRKGATAHVKLVEMHEPAALA